MKIAFIFCGSGSAAYSVSDGITTTLRRLGHHVLAFPRGRLDCPLLTVESLNMADAIIVSGPEHIFLQHVRGYPQAGNEYALSEGEITTYEWLNEVKPPKLFLYHESNHREDRTFGFEDILSYGDYHFFPAIQDAEDYNQEAFAKGRSFWLPFGVDTEIFHPPFCGVCHNGVTKLVCKECLGSGFAQNHKTVESGFIGLLYPKRQAYLQQMAQHMKRDRDPSFTVGNVLVQDVEGTPWHDQAERLAMNYRKIAVFLNLPSYSELLVTKVYEVMACGTFLITPIIQGPGQGNCAQFEHGKELAYYNTPNLPFLVQTVREFYQREPMREQIAAAGLAAVRERHSLKRYLEEVLATVAKPAEKVLVQ